MEVWGRLVEGTKIAYVCPKCEKEVIANEYTILRDQLVLAKCPKCGVEMEVNIECPEDCYECPFNCDIECSVPCEKCVRFRVCVEEGTIAYCNKCKTWYIKVCGCDCEF